MISDFRCIVVSFLFLAHGGAFAISGYTRLYNPFNRTTIDILYDDHIPQTHLTLRDMKRASVLSIEKRLEQSERRFLQSLRVINKRPKGSVALVWEQGINTDAHTEFIGHSHRLVKNQFKNIRYVASDISRDAFEELVYTSQRRGKRVICSIYGCSLENPLPLSKKQKESIVRNAGIKAWYEYKQFYAKTITSLKKHFGKRKYCTFADFENNDLFDSLADCEMLSHILAAGECHIILFAGGWHSRNIAQFLQKRLHCSLIYSSNPDNCCMPVAALDRITVPYTPKKDN